MKKGLTEIVFILDRSGSMEGLEADTVGGYNAFLHKQKAQTGEALISTVLFDDEVTVIHDRFPLDRVAPLTDRDYWPRGITALYDAVGGAIHHIGNVHKYIREEDRPEHTLFVITTDGLENASRRYNGRQVKNMIEMQQDVYGWKFLFLGANIDAAATAEGIGIDRKWAADYAPDSAGTRTNYEALSDAVGSMRMHGEVPPAWSAPIREDMRRRTK